MGGHSAPPPRRLTRLRAQLGASAAPALPLTPAQVCTFEQRGVLVLRSFFGEEELKRMAAPVAQLQGAARSPLRSAPPAQTKFNFPDFRALEGCPGLTAASLDHPRVVSAAQRLLGGETAELQQYGVLTWRPGADGFASHYDYKPARVVGSSVHWVFAVIPLTDYDRCDGPLLVAPGSAAQTSVLPRSASRGGGRVHFVDAAQVPGPYTTAEGVQADPAAAALIDPQLRRGDLLFTSCYTFHAAPSNQPPSTGRTGIYMKYRAASAPPATGPLLFRSLVAERLAHFQLMPHHRRDGTQRVDCAALVLEESGGTGRVWAVSPAGSITDSNYTLKLPRFEIEPTPQMTATTTAAWDASNVIGQVLTQLEHTTPFRPDQWLSWIADHHIVHPAGEEQQGREHLTRVYGHVLSAAAAARHTISPSRSTSPSNGTPGLTTGQFVEPEALESAEETKWVRMWTQSVDTQGRTVRRGIGLPVDAPDLGYNHVGRATERCTDTGLEHYRMGEFDEQEGLPRRNHCAA